jgi:hypothetical protein
MRYGLTAALAAAAILAATQASAGGMAGGRGAGGSHGFGGFHAIHGFGGFHGFYAPRFPFNQRDFLVDSPYGPFGSARPEGWQGGAYSGGVTAGFDDYGEGDDYFPEDLHFRVDEPFGPGDIGNRPPPPEPYDEQPWEGSRLAPWHGYGPDDQ